MRGNLSDEAVALLEIDGEEGLGLAANLCETGDILFAVDRDPDEVSARSIDDANLAERRLYISRLCRSHALDGDRRISPYGKSANIDLACLALRNHETAWYSREEDSGTGEARIRG